MYETLVFDLDLTLVEHEQTTDEVLDAACEDVGVDRFCDAVDLDAAAEIVRRRSNGIDGREYDRRLFAAAAAGAGVDVDAATFAGAYREAIDYAAVSLRPGACEALALADEYDVALVTNGSERTHAQKLDAVDIADRFDVVVYGSDVDRVKPDPEPIERALEALDGRPETALKIGDSLRKDVGAAATIGMDSVWIPYGDEEREPDDPTPTYRLESLAELSELPPFIRFDVVSYR